MASHQKNNKAPEIPASWEPVRERRLLCDAVVACIIDHIQENQMEVGARLPPERKLADQLNISRASLREAVRVLAAQGVLDVRHGSGIFVNDPSPLKHTLHQNLPSPVGISEMLAMREVLEVPAAGWAAKHATGQEIAALIDLVDRMDDAAGRQQIDYDSLSKHDRNFHALIAKAARNPFLSEVSSILRGMLMVSMETTLSIPGRARQASGEHRAIIAAIASKNPAAARAAMRKHIRGVENAVRHRISLIV